MTTFTGTNADNTFNLGFGATYTIDGLDGVDTVTLGAAVRSGYTITRDADGTVRVDVISAASEQLHLTLKNVEILVFSRGSDRVDLRTYFGDVTAPTITSFNPGISTADVVPNKDIVLTFNEVITKGNGLISITAANGTPFATYDILTSPNVTISGNTVTINPSADLNFNTSYNVTLGTGTFKDLAGNNFIGSSSYNFTTVAGGAIGGTTRADNLIGTINNEVINGLDGNDLITGGGGNDQINGGNGIDTAVFSGRRAEYIVSGNAANATVSDSLVARDGTDTLTQVERLQFADGAVAFDIAKGQNAGDVYRIYQAAFNRKPDASGLGFWINSLDQGVSLTTIAKDFVGSAEFKALYGATPSNSALVTNFYANVLQRAPDQGGFDFWLGLLNNGTINAADALKSFSESDENVAQVIGSIQNGIEFTFFAG
jgi:hypothetical protein